MFEIFSVTASGMEAQRLRMNVISSNLANAQTTRTESGGPYVRKDVVFSTRPVGEFNGYLRASLGDHNVGVNVDRVINDNRPFKIAYEPSHPDADAEGYVAYPNVNTVEEMTNMITAARSYEANVTAFKAARDMANKALEIAG